MSRHGPRELFCSELFAEIVCFNNVVHHLSLHCGFFWIEQFGLKHPVNLIF
jgi:hypothetical protein